MIRRQGGWNSRITFVCDECGDTFDSSTGDFGSALDEMKADGWRVRKDEEDGSWLHECPDCR